MEDDEEFLIALREVPADIQREYDEADVSAKLRERLMGKTIEEELAEKSKPVVAAMMESEQAVVTGPEYEAVVVREAESEPVVARKTEGEPVEAAAPQSLEPAGARQGGQSTA